MTRQCSSNMEPLSWKTEPKAFFLTSVYKYTIHLGQHFNISCHFHSKHGTTNVSATSHRARREVSPTWSCSSIWFGILRASAERMVISWLVHLRGWEWYRYHPVDFIHIHWKHWSIGQSVKIWQDPSSNSQNLICSLMSLRKDQRRICRHVAPVVPVVPLLGSSVHK